MGENKKYYCQDITWCCNWNCKRHSCNRNPIHILEPYRPHCFADFENTDICEKPNKKKGD